MKIKPENYYSKYFTLRNEIDTIIESVEKQHMRHLNCKKGCDMCCIDYSIFPIEYYSILEKLLNKPFELRDIRHMKGKCVFLKNGTCTIYDERPVICRTHGLPLLYTNEDGEWELSVCELNFTRFNFEKFSAENTFPQDTFNSKLFVLNQEFISSFTAKKYDRFSLIPLKQLYSAL